MVINKNKNSKKFRISAKRMFLTYSKVPENIDTDEVLSELQRKHRFSRYLIAEELHKDKGKHIHVLLESTGKFNIRSASELNLDFGEIKLHGNYQEARNYKKVASYISKEKKYITNYPNFLNGDFLSVEEDIIRVAPILGAKGTSEYFLKNYPTKALRGMTIRNSESFVEAINKTCQDKTSQDTIEEKAMPFKLNDFELPDKLSAWVRQGFQPTLLLVGDGGTYKTSFCKTLAHEMSWNMLVCNHLEALKGLKEEHNAILFDDITLSGLDEQQLLAVFATDDTKHIRVLNGTVVKPRGLIQMITLNTNFLKKLKNKINHTQYLRRLQLVLLDKPLIQEQE